ncbi:putative molybdenum transport system protein [Pyrodictium delaneyi]|uniref:Nicotinate-nucleotide pyrophosphorylase [carboxylating] n=1 Tax=Pyrodictium delaneyi TaxID=1273541 RepID=A0A0P0N2S7_9CREN|nr:ModD protein [Pyrodictium delaneyi]ALL00804.1 putative molybdenum transport system protein [Pyrodictium delaneyi]OWJ55562.1 ModD protein [Pyrodictium delaneyi]
MESEGCTWWFFTPTSLIDEWIREDTAYTDFTTGVLGISWAPGRARLTTRERIVACGLREAAIVYERLGAKARLLHPEGEWAEPGTALLEAEGPAAALHAAWRLAQTIASIGSGVATYTRRLVERARAANPRIVVAVARKAPPGIRHVYYRCVLCGGATLHRLGLSETILVFRNHVVFLGGLEKALERLHRAKSQIGERSVVVEAETPEDALLAAKSGVVDEIQLDHIEPRRLKELVEELRSVNPGIRVAVGGGINLDNVAEYAAAGADVLVTSAPYWAKPADLTTRMEPL